MQQQQAAQGGLKSRSADGNVEELSGAAAAEMPQMTGSRRCLGCAVQAPCIRLLPRQHQPLQLRLPFCLTLLAHHTAVYHGVQVAVICGRNKKLLQELHARQWQGGSHVVACGFVDNIHEVRAGLGWGRVGVGGLWGCGQHPRGGGR